MYYTSIVVFSAVFFICAGLLASCGAASHSKKMIPTENGNKECVILFHGLGRTYRSMGEMQTKLTQIGYITVNFDYPSREKSIEQLASDYMPLALEQCYSENPVKIHFVTHSLGGIVVRAALKQNVPEKLGRIVMLSPPNQGSEAVDDLKESWYYSWINGPAGQELSTSEDSVPNQLGPVDYPVGIIIGDRQAFFDFWLLDLFRGANDGKVSVERAKVDGMTAFLVVHENHTYIMDSEYVQFQTAHFLGKGFFSQDNTVVPELSRTND